MSRLHLRAAVLSVLTALLSGAAFAKLPPPTPEEVAAAEAAKEKAATAAAAEQAALAKAQDRVAAEYKSRKGKEANAGGTSGSSGTTEVPSAALHTRPSEKAGAYNEGVTPATAPGASSGTKEGIAPRPQGKDTSSR